MGGGSGREALADEGGGERVRGPDAAYEFGEPEGHGVGEGEVVGEVAG